MANVTKAQIAQAQTELLQIIGMGKLDDELRERAVTHISTLRFAADTKQPDGTVFCLFSIANDYDQPRNNLVAWWAEKPTFETFCKCFEVTIEPGADVLTVLDKYGEALLSLKEIYNGKEARVFGNTDYRLEEVAEGVILSNEDN